MLEVQRQGRPVDLGAFRERALPALLLTTLESGFPTDRIIDERGVPRLVRTNTARRGSTCPASAAPSTPAREALRRQDGTPGSFRTGMIAHIDAARVALEGGVLDPVPSCHISRVEVVSGRPAGRVATPEP